MAVSVSTYWRICWLELSADTFIEHFLTNLQSKVSLCTDALRWDSIGVGVGVHQNFNVGLFSDYYSQNLETLPDGSMW